MLTVLKGLCGETQKDVKIKEGVCCAQCRVWTRWWHFDSTEAERYRPALVTIDVTWRNISLKSYSRDVMKSHNSNTASFRWILVLTSDSVAICISGGCSVVGTAMGTPGRFQLGCLTQKPSCCGQIPLGVRFNCQACTAHETLQIEAVIPRVCWSGLWDGAENGGK